MVLYEIFSHSDRFHYRSNIFSLATLFLIICTILTFLPPILFTYYAGGFWIKEGTYTEQPRINYSSKYIVIAETSEATNRFFVSSYQSINEIYSDFLIPGISTSSLIDNNNDGIPDQISITFQLLFAATTATTTITNIHVWLIFQYELWARQYISMETMALINPLIPNTLKLSDNPNITVVGDLVFEQRKPIQSSGYDVSYNKSIISVDNLFTTSAINLSPLLDQYFARTYYTSFQTRQTQLKSAAVTDTTVNLLEINAIVNIRRQTIRFIPGFWQEFKWGWIQYVCVLLPFIFAFHYIKEFVFRNQLVKTLVDKPLGRCKT